MRVLAVLAVLALAASSGALGQEQPLQPGQRVRVTVPILDVNKHKATFQRMSGDTLVLDSESYSLSDVTRLDVYRGRKSNTAKGALYGVLIGTSLGAIASVAWIADDCEFIDTSGCGSDETVVMIGGTVVLAVVGSGIGAGIGALTKTDKWDQVPLDRLRVSVVPQRGGRFGFGVSVAF